MVTPDGESPATVLFSGGLITAVAGYGDAPPGTVDLPDDQVLLPGLVDSHVHVNEPGRTGWEGFATATAAAAAGGVTTIVDMPLNSIPATVSVAALDTKRRAALGQLAVDVAFWGGAVPGNVADLRPLHDAGVTGFKCFLLPSGVAEFAPLDEAGLAAAMTEIASFGGLLIAHAEDEQQIEAAPQAHGKRYATFAASRPPAAEVRAIERLLAGTRRTGCRTHIVHLAAAEALPLIRAAKAEGLPVTAETCPHYLTLRDKDVPDGATQFKCCPPIRGEANRAALWDGLGDGTIDCVVSDHSPCPPELKGLPDLDALGRAGGQPACSSVHLDLRLITAGGDFGDGVGRDRLAPARPAGDVDRGPAAGDRPARPGPVDGRRPGPADRAGRPRRDRAWPAGRPVRVRAGRHVHGGPGPAAAPASRDPVHRPRTARHGQPHLAGRPSPAGPDDRSGQLTRPPGRRA